MTSAPPVLFLAVFGVVLSLGYAQAPAAKKSSGKSTKTRTTKSTAVQTAPTKAVARASPSGSRTTSGKKSVHHVAPGPPRQGAPTPDRYKEIQQALAAKGYLKSEPNGVWDAQSIEAMRQYQTERNLEPTGKLTAAALIDLGLGPKNETHSPPPGPAAQVPEPPRIETAPQP